MPTIIAARLQLQIQAEEAVDKLIKAGFSPEKVTSFYLNPPGQHALYPIGGDRYQDPATTEATHVAIDGVIAEAAEAVIGTHSHIEKQEKIHSEPVIDPNSAWVEPTSSAAPQARAILLRRAGMMVAVELINQTGQDEVVTLLKELGAKDIEKAEGEIVGGEWLDFDPLSEPCYL